MAKALGPGNLAHHCQHLRTEVLAALRRGDFDIQCAREGRYCARSVVLETSLQDPVEPLAGSSAQPPWKAIGIL